MSAFVVGDKTINKVLAWLGEASHAEEREEILVVAGFAPNHNWLGNLGTVMKQMNVDAVNQRHNLYDLYEQAYFNYQRLPVASDITTLKALRCWQHQCCEGDIPQEPLYQILDVLGGKIAERIVVLLPAYDAAE